MPQAATSLRSVAWLTLLTLLQMGLQFGLQIVLARRFGAESSMDEFFAASTLPLVVSGLLAGAVTSAFVPVFVETRERSGDAAAWTMAVQVTCWLTLITVLFWQLSKKFAQPWMETLHPGFDTIQVWDTAELFTILSSLFVWNTLGGLARAWNHCLGRFARTGWSAVAGQLLAFGWVWMRAVGDGAMNEVARGVVFGSLATFALQMPWAAILSRGWPTSVESQAAVARCARLAAPLLVVLACTQLDPLLDRYLTSQLSPAQPGVVSHLGYASRLSGAFLTLISSGLAVVAFPALAAQAAACDEVGMRREVAAGFRFLIVLLVPVIVALVLFNVPIVRDLYQRGRFHEVDTVAVGGLLAILSGLLFGGCVGELAGKVFYARQDMRTPVLIGMLGFGMAVVVKCWSFRRWGVTGLAAATSGYYLINAVVLLMLIRTRNGAGFFSGTVATSIRSIIAATCAAVVGYSLLRLSWPFPAIRGGLAGAAMYGFVLLLLRDEFAVRACQMVIDVVSPTRTATEK